jgi:spore coat protein U-like protein
LLTILIASRVLKERPMIKSVKLWAAGGLLAAALPMGALAQTITINATVNSQCNIGNATVALGTVNLLGSTTLTNTGTNIVLTCNRGATVTVALGNGTNPSGTQKRMTDGTDFILYNISQPTLPLINGVNTCPGTLPGTEWNTAIAGTPMYVASGGPRNIPLCVSVPVPQFPQANTYSDTVTATLTVT